MNDAASIQARSRGEIRQHLKRLAGLCLEALGTESDNELRPVEADCHVVAGLIARHLERARRINEAVAESPAPIVPFRARLEEDRS